MANNIYEFYDIASEAKMLMASLEDVLRGNLSSTFREELMQLFARYQALAYEAETLAYQSERYYHNSAFTMANAFYEAYEAPDASLTKEKMKELKSLHNTIYQKYLT